MGRIPNLSCMNRTHFYSCKEGGTIGAFSHLYLHPQICSKVSGFCLRHPIPIFGLYQLGHGHNRRNVPSLSGHTGVAPRLTESDTHQLLRVLETWGEGSYVGGVHNSAPSFPYHNNRMGSHGESLYLVNTARWVGERTFQTL